MTYLSVVYIFSIFLNLVQSIDPYFAISERQKRRKIRVDRKIRGCKIRVDALYCISMIKKMLEKD